MRSFIIFSAFVLCLCLLILLLPMEVAQAEAIVFHEKGFDASVELTVLHEGQAVSMPLRAYLAGVVSAEMPSTFPLEALKAQAVAARTFALQARKHENADICTDSACCQAWTSDANAQAELAVLQTDGLVVTYENALIEATYFSCSGGMTEPAAAVWGSDVPYLQAVDSPGEEDAPGFSETVEIEAALFASRLQALYPEVQLLGSAPSWFGKIRYSVGGGIASIELGGVEISGTSLRGLFGLRSTHMQFAVSEDSIQITTYGYGHRVGMSQYGARAMAERDSDFAQILTHYYQNAEIKRLFLTEEAQIGTN